MPGRVTTLHDCMSHFELIISTPNMSLNGHAFVAFAASPISKVKPNGKRKAANRPLIGEANSVPKIFHSRDEQLSTFLTAQYISQSIDRRIHNPHES